MTTSGSSIISALGAGSGIDFTRLASDLSAATFANQRQNVTSRSAAIEARISAASSLRSMMTALASAVGDRLRAGDLAPRASVSNPAVVAVTTAPGSAPRGSYTLEITELATAQRLVMPPLPGGDAALGTGTLMIRQGTVDGAGFAEDSSRPAIAISVAAGDSLETIAGRITSATGAAVSAQVLNGANGAQLVLTGREGAANAFVVDATGTGALTSLAWHPGAPGTVQMPGTARDAAFTLNGVEMRSANNTVNNLPEGISLQLTMANPGAPATITFPSDPGAITRLMDDLVAALNEVVTKVSEVGNPVGGELGNDPGVRQLRRELAQLAGRVVMPNAAAGDPRTLADLGLALNRDGTFRLDATRLSQAMNDHPLAVSAMFTTGVSGVFATVERLARNTTRVGDPGTLGGSLARYQRQLQGNNVRLERISVQQEQLRERLTRNFSASERRVSGSQATLSFLQQQVDLWAAQRR